MNRRFDTNIDRTLNTLVLWAVIGVFFATTFSIVLLLSSLIQAVLS